MPPPGGPPIPVDASLNQRRNRRTKIALITGGVAIVAIAAIVAAIVMGVMLSTGPSSKNAAPSSPASSAPLSSPTSSVPSSSPTSSPASAAPVLSGHYVETETFPPTGQTTTNDWYFTPCGDGCASVASNGSPLAQARLVNGQWRMDATADSVCSDGTRVQKAFSNHYTWDPNTLAGTAQITANVAACGRPVGDTFSVNVQFRQAP